MTYVLNSIKIYQLVKKLLGGTTDNRRTDRQTGDLIRLTFLFKESRLKMRNFQTNSPTYVPAMNVSAVQAEQGPPCLVTKLHHLPVSKNLKLCIVTVGNALF
jgi:hypothetical protein